MSMPRFYAPDALFCVGGHTVLTDAARHHAGRVLRLAAGADITLFDGLGTQASGPIAFEGTQAYITVRSVEQPQRESPVDMTLVQALVPPEKMDWIVEKAVEAGVKHLIIAPAARSVTRLSAERLSKRMAHWRDIAVSSCEQCGRNVLPDIAYEPSLAGALNRCTSALRLILAPGAHERLDLRDARSVAFAVGPEGGFTAGETDAAVQCGWQPCLLGPRVLRTETAGLVAAAAVNALSGEYCV